MSSIELPARPDFRKTSAGLLLRREILEMIENVSVGTVLLCSMAGYGKSVLLSQLAERADFAALLVADYSDNNLQYFLNHLFAVVHKIAPKPKSDEIAAESQLLRQICQLARENKMTLLLDNCQLIEDEGVCRVLQYLISEAENGFKIVIGSREIPGFAARFILENRCQLLGRDRLALSESEVGQLFSIYLGEENAAVARDLHAFTGGWAVAVTCFLRGSSRISLNKGIDLGLIKKYIGFELLAALPPLVVAFAKQASLLDRFSADICDAVLQTAGSRECLNFLLENEIFLRQCPGEAGFFEWIDIFQRVFLDLLTAEEKDLIAENTVEYYLKHKMYFEAVSFALKLGQAALICQALSRCGSILLQQEQFELLGKCALILEHSHEQPEAFIYGILAQYYYVVGDYAQMDNKFNLADSLFGKENIYSVQRSLYRGLLRFASDPPKYLKLVNNALFYLNEYNLKLPFLLPQEMGTLEKIKLLNAAEQKSQDEKPLKAQQFGPFKLIVKEDGYEISWRTKKAAELLSYLIALEGRSVDRNQLFDIIWPDELPNNPVAMLHNMIYNIRKELSAFNLETLIQYKNKGYQVDMDLIEHEQEAVSYICEAVSRQDIDTLLENERMLSVYWGRYLENISSSWVMEQQEYYDKVFISASLLLADYFYEHRIYEKALSFLQNAQKVDSFSERVMEKILNCHAKLGNFNKLRSKYDEFCAMLYDELDIQPSTELTSAYQRGMQRKA